MEVNKPIASIILLIVNLILIFLFLIPKNQESQDLQVGLAKKQAEYDNQSNYSLKLLNTIKNIESRQDVLEKINSALPSNFSLASIINFLQKKAEENQLTIESVTFLNVPGEGLLTGSDGQALTNENSSDSMAGIKQTILTVNVSGSYRGLKGFISSLDRSARLFQIETIFFTQLEQENDNLDLDQSKNYDFNLEIKTYSY